MKTTGYQRFVKSINVHDEDKKNFIMEAKLSFLLVVLATLIALMFVF